MLSVLFYSDFTDIFFYIWIIYDIYIFLIIKFMIYRLLFLRKESYYGMDYDD